MIVVSVFGAWQMPSHIPVGGANPSAVMTSTLVVVMITTFVFGGLTEPMLRYNGMKLGNAKKSPKPQVLPF